MLCPVGLGAGKLYRCCVLYAWGLKWLPCQEMLKKDDASWGNDYLGKWVILIVMLRNVPLERRPAEGVGWRGGWYHPCDATDCWLRGC